MRTVFLCLILCIFSSAAFAQRTIYLTFDDGPLEGTSNILDVIQAQNVPATMFMVGLHADASGERAALVTKAKSIPFITVGNHSYTHANNHYRLFYSSVEELLADLARANTALGLTGNPIHARLPGRNVFRLPDLSSDDLSIGKPEDRREEPDFEFVAASGYFLYGWDHEWVHENSGKPVQTVDHLLGEIDHLFGFGKLARPNKLILLMHDEMFQDTFNGADNLKALITGLKVRGYTFGRIKDYDAG